MVLYLETGPLKNSLRLNEVIWCGPDPIGLVSLQEEEETPGVLIQGEKAM